jgi:IS30 family transposase|tara:strand:+ start:222 stop:437 length:216 start_codon:yes stop_codon:yes gene_type:complete
MYTNVARVVILCDNIIVMKKYEHNIDLYKKLRNEGMSWREIAKHLDIPESTLFEYIKRNYTEVVIYDYIKK